MTLLFHNSATTSHPSIAKTIALISEFYWWPLMWDFVTQYIKRCTTCQSSKINTHPVKVSLYSIKPAHNALPFQTIAMDFIVKLLLSKGFNMILTITDHDCSKAAIFVPCNESINAPGVATLYAQHVFFYYSILSKVILDHDTHFTAHFAKELCRVLGVKQNISMVYHPQTDG